MSERFDLPDIVYHYRCRCGEFYPAGDRCYICNPCLCRHCGRDTNGLEIRYMRCPHCGDKLLTEEEDAVCVWTFRFDQRRGWISETKCGHELRIVAVDAVLCYCPYCGKKRAATAAGEDK